MPRTGESRPSDVETTGDTSPAACLGLRGRVAIVTGASRGIGRGIACSFAEAGVDVILAARASDELESAREQIDRAGGRALVLPTDVNDRSQVERLVAESLREFGTIDILVNNAGIAVERSLLDTTDDDWDLILNTDLRGLFFCCRAVGRHMVSAGRGKIINLASVFGFVGTPRYVAYSAAKGGVVAFTRALAIEWARYGIQVNAIAPGHVPTDLNRRSLADQATADHVIRSIPARRFGTPGEIGQLALYLASDASDFVTGQTIVIDGGFVSS